MTVCILVSLGWLAVSTCCDISAVDQMKQGGKEEIDGSIQGFLSYIRDAVLVNVNLI